MKTIIIDTNALMAIEEVDLFEEIQNCCDFPYKIAILSGTIKELKKIQEEQRGKFARAAKLTVQIIKTKPIEIIKDDSFVDDALATYSKEGHLVLTQDQELKKRLTKPYLTIRQKKKVVMIQ